jgi:hypothetical protein
MLRGRGAPAPAAAPAPPLYSAKAGLMQSTPAPGGSSTSLKADKRRGELLLKRDQDGMLHVQWADRAGGNLGFDRPVFPGDVTLKRIQTPNVRGGRWPLPAIVVRPHTPSPPPPPPHPHPPFFPTARGPRVRAPLRGQRHPPVPVDAGRRRGGRRGKGEGVLRGDCGPRRGSARAAGAAPHRSGRGGHRRAAGPFVSAGGHGRGRRAVARTRRGQRRQRRCGRHAAGRGGGRRRRRRRRRR